MNNSYCAICGRRLAKGDHRGLGGKLGRLSFEVNLAIDGGNVPLANGKVCRDCIKQALASAFLLPPDEMSKEDFETIVRRAVDTAIHGAMT